jgi:hypothetical protein
MPNSSSREDEDVQGVELTRGPTDNVVTFEDPDWQLPSCE